MKKQMITALKLIMVCVLFGLVIAHKSRTPRFLIIHSYNVDYAWVRDINIGLKRVFDKHYDITFRFHYMDLKNHQDKDFKRRAEEAAHKLIQSWQPDVMILFDDLAQRLVGIKYLNQNESLHKSIQIVFAGVNGAPEDYGYNDKKVRNVTGILERKPLNALKDTLELIAKDKGFDLEAEGQPKPKIVFLGTKSASITAEIKSYKDKEWWQPLEWLDPIQVDTYGNWIDQVKALKYRADILLVTNYRRLKVEGEEELAKPHNVIKETQIIFKKPVVGMNYFNVEDGGALAVGPSPYEQGDVAAKMAICIADYKKQEKDREQDRDEEQERELGDVESKKPFNCKEFIDCNQFIKCKQVIEGKQFIESKQFIIAIRKEELEKWKIELPPIYEAFARATDNYW